MIPRNAIRFYGLVLGAAALVTMVLAWYRGVSTPRGLVDLATFVAIGFAFIAFPFMGPGRYSNAYRLEEDPSHSESPNSLSNRARGVLALAAAASWLGIAIAFDFATR